MSADVDSLWLCEMDCGVDILLEFLSDLIANFEWLEMPQAKTVVEQATIARDAIARAGAAIEEMRKDVVRERLEEAKAK